MKILPVLLVLSIVIVSCSKQDIVNPETDSQNKPVTCEFGQTSFNLEKRAPLSDDLTGRGKPPKNTGSGGTGGTGTTSPAVILLDFDGHLVSNTIWNYNGNITCAPANLSYEAMSMIFDRIANDFSPFNVTVTTDEAVFNAAAGNRRMRIIFTESWEWFGQAGGTAYYNSFGMTGDNPGFVFTSLLNYNHKAIAEAGSHEMGHTLGLLHQSSYSGQTLLNQYNYGGGSGETGWAPIMGCGYYQNLTTWHNGPTTDGYNIYQDDINKITSKLGLNPDDHPGTTTGAQTLSTIKTGVINNSSDIDFFYVNTNSTVTINVVPDNVATGNSGSNTDLVMKIHNSQGQLITTINDPSILNAGATLNPGIYYVSVSVAANSSAAVYGMLGKYSISLD